MPTVRMPQLGESVEEGTIGKWLKKEGDHVAVGEPLVEVITDKVNAEVPSPFEGTLSRILVDEGATVQNEAEIAEVETAGQESATGETTGAPASDAVGAPPGQTAPSSATMEGTADGERRAAVPSGPGPSADTATTRAQPTPGSAVAVDEPAGPASSIEGPGEDSSSAGDAPRSAPPGGNGAASGSGVAGTATELPTMPGASQPAQEGPAPFPGSEFRGRLTPAVRRLAREHAIDLSTVQGTGMGGRITRADVERAIASGSTALPDGAAEDGRSRTGAPASSGTGATATATVPAPTPEPPSVVAAGDSLKKLSPMRRAIAAQMTRSLEVPTAYVTVEVDMTPVVRRREADRSEYQAREGVSLSYVAFVTKACVEALRRHPDLNAHWTAEGHWRRRAVNVGIAVAVEDGLVVPVIRDADTLSVHGLNLAINDLARRARDRKLRPEELEGGTFTVDNTGWTGSILTLPIINVPEVAIITMERIVKRPVVLDGPDGEAIAVRSMMNMCLAIDHRATDGAQAGAFLADVRSRLESVDERTAVW